MTKFNHGDPVTCTIDGTIITDAKISINSNGTPFICQNEQDGGPADNRFGYRYGWELNPDFTDYYVKNLTLARPRTIDDIQVGDVIVHHLNDEDHPILMRSGEVVVFGVKRDYGYATSGNFTIAELKHHGYTLKQPEVTAPVPTKLTVAQIAEKLGYEVEIIK